MKEIDLSLQKKSMNMKFPDMEPLRILLNNKPSEDFCGMSPNEVHHLLYKTFKDESPLKIKSFIEDSTLDKIPFFRLTEEMMKIGKRENYIKITPLGALTRKVLHELYEHKFIPEYFIESGISKLTREHDAPTIRAAHFNALITGVFAEVKGKMILTTYGHEMLEHETRCELFKKIIESYTTKFDWSINDGYTDYPVGQLGWGYTIFLLYKFGNTSMTKQFYADMYLKAFPKFLDEFPQREFGTPQRDYTNCYTIRSFDRFAEWFGFAEDLTKNEKDRNGNFVVKTEILEKIFHFEI
jgi:hypothetical protein